MHLSITSSFAKPRVWLAAQQMGPDWHRGREQVKWKCWGLSKGQSWQTEEGRFVVQRVVVALAAAAAAAADWVRSVTLADGVDSAVLQQIEQKNNTRLNTIGL
jgi:hypothetical protein